MDPAILETLSRYWSDVLSASADLHAVRSTAFLTALAIPLSWLIALPAQWTANLPRPIALFGKPASYLDRKLNRRERSHRNRLIRGAIVAIFLIALGASVGAVFDTLVRAIPGGWIVELAIVLSFLGSRALFFDALSVEKMMKKKDVAGARRIAGRFAGRRETANLDTHGLARLSIEHMSGRLTERLATPAFFYLLFGLPGLFAQIALRAADRRVGHETPDYEDFGFIPAKLDDAAHWLPTRLVGLSFALAACFQPKANPLNALGVMIQFGGRHPSPKAGFGTAALAGAFDFALEGPRSLRPDTESASNEPVIVKHPWMGDGRARLGTADIAVSRGLFALANLILWIPVILIATVSG